MLFSQRFKDSTTPTAYRKKRSVDLQVVPSAEIYSTLFCIVDFCKKKIRKGCVKYSFVKNAFYQSIHASEEKNTSKFLTHYINII